MLSVINTKKPTYDSGIDYNGQRLHIRPASKHLYEQITACKSTMERNLKNGKALDEAYKLVGLVLNENAEGVNISAEEIDTLDIGSILELLSGYTEFLRGLKNHPN